MSKNCGVYAAASLLPISHRFALTQERPALQPEALCHRIASQYAAPCGFFCPVLDERKLLPDGWQKLPAERQKSRDERNAFIKGCLRADADGIRYTNFGGLYTYLHRPLSAPTCRPRIQPAARIQPPQVAGYTGHRIGGRGLLYTATKKPRCGGRGCRGGCRLVLYTIQKRQPVGL